MTIIRPPYADAPGAIRPTLAEDRYRSDYPQYAPEIRPARFTTAPATGSAQFTVRVDTEQLASELRRTGTAVVTAVRLMHSPLYPVPGGRIHVRVIPGPMPESLRAAYRYGRHSKANTRAARGADLARWGELHDLILHLAAERVEARRTGQALTTRSAS